MTDHKVLVVEIINWLIGKLFAVFGLEFHGLPNHLVMTGLVSIIIIVLFKLLVKNVNLFPTPLQHGVELFYRFFQGLVDDMMGREGRKFIPLLATIGIFIAVSNLIGLMPEFAAPTSNINVPAGCAVFVFVYYHYQGIRKHGFVGYLKTFMGPVWWLAPLFFPIEVVSHFSRPMSLTLRLFGNIFGEDMVIIVVASLAKPIGGALAPLPIMALGTFTSMLQAFIFVMLTTIYLAGAMSEEH